MVGTRRGAQAMLGVDLTSTSNTHRSLGYHEDTSPRRSCPQPAPCPWRADRQSGAAWDHVAHRRAARWSAGAASVIDYETAATCCQRGAAAARAPESTVHWVTVHPEHRNSG